MVNMKFRGVFNFIRSLNVSGGTVYGDVWRESRTHLNSFQYVHRLGNITLHDFKTVFSQPGPFRYHFKALDPEFGTVKEEVGTVQTIFPSFCLHSFELWGEVV